MPEVDRASPLPVYFQVAVDLRRRLHGGEWAAKARIAPELALAEQYGVSRVTIRQALAELVKDDLLERRRGSGTYVRENARPLVYDLNLSLAEYATWLREHGFDNSGDILETGVTDDPPEEVCAHLQLAPGRRAAFLVRRIRIDGEPIGIYRSWFAADVVPGIESAAGLDRSLSAILADDYGLVPARVEKWLEVVRSTREETALLDTTADVPILMETLTTFLADGRPLEHAQTSWLGDRVRFRITAVGGVAAPPQRDA